MYFIMLSICCLTSSHSLVHSFNPQALVLFSAAEWMLWHCLAFLNIYITLLYFILLYIIYWILFYSSRYRSVPVTVKLEHSGFPLK